MNPTISLSATLTLHTQPQQRTPPHSLPTVALQSLDLHQRPHYGVYLQSHPSSSIAFLFSNSLTSGQGRVWAGLDFPFTRYLRPKPQGCPSGLTPLLLLFPPFAHHGSVILCRLFKVQHRHPCSPILQPPQALCSTSHPCPGPGILVLHLYTEPHTPPSDPHFLCSVPCFRCLEHLLHLI